MNTTISIDFENANIAKIVYDSYLKNYIGNLLEEPIKVNITRIMNKDIFQEISSVAANRVSETERKVNNLIFDIYNLSDSHKYTIEYE